MNADQRTDSEGRHEAARRAITALAGDLAEHQRLMVQCPRSHHVAAVFETGAGLVYRAVTGPHSHGSRDRVDVAHHSSHHGEYVDLLAAGPMADDNVPASCACGPWTLSRSQLLSDIRSGQRTVHLS
jgi:hypothetical protein